MTGVFYRENIKLHQEGRRSLYSVRCNVQNSRWKGGQWFTLEFFPKKKLPWIVDLKTLWTWSRMSGRSKVKIRIFTGDKSLRSKFRCHHIRPSASPEKVQLSANIGFYEPFFSIFASSHLKNPRREFYPPLREIHPSL